MSSSYPPFQTDQYAADRTQTLSGLRFGKTSDNLKLTQAFQAKYPRDGFSNHILAQALIEIGKPQEALRFAQFAVQFSNLNPDSVSQLAQLYLEFAVYEQLGPLLTKAVIKSPGSAILASDFGDYYSAIGDIESAIQQYQRAIDLTINDRHRDAVKRSLVDTLRGANRHAEAESLLDELKSKSEHRAFFLSRRSHIGKQDANSPLAAEIEAALSDDKSTMPPAERALLHISLGRLFENSKNYDTAFSHWQRAKEIDKAPYDFNVIEQSAALVKALYTAELFNSTRAFANPSNAPVFVIGMPRSGTTLMEQILASHPKAAGVGELGVLGRRGIHFLRAYGNPGGRELLQSNAMKGELLARTNEFLNVARLFARKNSEKIVDKTPTQFFVAGFIHLCFPNAKFIHLNRHPADTFISTYQNNFTKDFGFAFDQRAFAHYYLQKEKLMGYWRSVFGHNIIDVRYEKLVANPEKLVREILEFVDLDWEPNCLNFFERQSSVRTFSKDQVRSAINSNSIRRWKNYEMHLMPLLEALEAAKFEYEPV